MSTNDPNAPVLKYPLSFLPGFKLRIEETPSLKPGKTLESSPDSHPSDFFIYLKHFNPAFRLFPGQDPSLTVTYTGGIKDTPEQIEGDAIDFYEKMLPTSEEDIDPVATTETDGIELDIALLEDTNAYVNDIDTVTKGKLI